MMKDEHKYFVFDGLRKYNYKHYIKLYILFALDFVYKIILVFSKRSADVKQYEVSICAIFKNEGHNLREWIEYHKIVGVQHFFLYNNFSEDNYAEILRPYIEDHIVTLIEWPVESGQFPAYQHFYENFKGLTRWVSFLDLDEFITPFKDQSLSEWLRNYNFYPCIIVYWKMFGSNGNINHDFNKLTIEQYHVCWAKMYNVGKVFYNTDFQIAFFNAMVHHATVTKLKIFNTFLLIPPINEFKKFVKWDIHRVGVFRKKFTIQINHYWSKSFAYYFENKVKRGDVNNHERTIETFFEHEVHNNSTDYKIYRHLIGLKRAMGLTRSIEENE